MKSFDEIVRNLSNAIDKYKDKMVGVGEIRIDYMAEDCLMFIKEQQKEIEQLKAKQTKWKPVSEGLPKEEKEYLIQIKHHFTPDDDFVQIIKILFVNNHWFSLGDHYDVIAWQPLPEPYKEEEK